MNEVVWGILAILLEIIEKVLELFYLVVKNNFDKSILDARR